MMTKVPAEIMELDTKGLLKEGYDADIVVFDADISIQKVFLQGEQVV
jgi:N-acetylglucosamine-6-phosphate deacetylase